MTTSCPTRLPRNVIAPAPARRCPLVIIRGLSVSQSYCSEGEPSRSHTHTLQPIGFDGHSLPPVASAVVVPFPRNRSARSRSSASSPRAPVFTPFVRMLMNEGSPSNTAVLSILSALRGVLIGELRKRGLLHRAPRLLGVEGHPHWIDHRATDTRQPLGDALGELLVDCYTEIFVQRLPRLAAQLADKPTIEGLVFLNVKHFVHDRQRRHDPLGYRMFHVLHSALRALADDDKVTIVGNHRRIRNNTDIILCTGATAIRDARVLEPVAELWADTLLPDFVTAQGKGLVRVTRCVETLLRQLPTYGVEAFRFQALIDPLKQAIRSRWHARHANARPEFACDDATSLSTATVEPDSAFERRDSYRALRRRLVRRLDASDLPPRTRRYLRRLWRFLCAYADDDLGPRFPTSASDRMPSYRQLSGMLGIPRERLPELFGLLRRLISEQPPKAELYTLRTGANGG